MLPARAAPRPLRAPPHHAQRFGAACAAARRGEDSCKPPPSFNVHPSVPKLRDGQSSTSVQKCSRWFYFLREGGRTLSETSNPELPALNANGPPPRGQHEPQSIQLGINPGSSLARLTSFTPQSRQPLPPPTPPGLPGAAAQRGEPGRPRLKFTLQHSSE